MISKWPSLTSRLYALSGSTHPTEDTEAANPLQKPLVIIFGANTFLIEVSEKEGGIQTKQNKVK